MSDDLGVVKQDRRRDRRLPMQARVHIAPRRSAAPVVADLVDVSAGGLRAAAPSPVGLIAGSAVDVEIRMPKKDSTLRDVDFRGAAVVLRLDGVGGQVHTALRFIGPLDVREPFSHLAVTP